MRRYKKAARRSDGFLSAVECPKILMYTQTLRFAGELLVPWGPRGTIPQLVEVLIDHEWKHAEELALVAHTLRANINLIRYTEVKGLPFDRPTTADVHAFQEVLRKKRVNAHLRASRGRDIAAACGQLRHERRG